MECLCTFNICFSKCSYYKIILLQSQKKNATPPFPQDTGSQGRRACLCYTEVQGTLLGRRWCPGPGEPWGKGPGPRGLSQPMAAKLVAQKCQTLSQGDGGGGDQLLKL